MTNPYTNIYKYTVKDSMIEGILGKNHYLNPGCPWPVSK
eukprot:UN06632